MWDDGFDGKVGGGGRKCFIVRACVCVCVCVGGTHGLMDTHTAGTYQYLLSPV